MITLKHLFLRRCIDFSALLKGCQKLNTFLGRIEKQAEIYAGGDEDLQNQDKGWALELFAEFLIKSHPMDKRIGISDYRLVDEDDDTGVDGYGVGIDGKPATVQVKYRQDNYILTANADHLGNFKAASFSSKFKVDPTPNNNGKCNMLIITTGRKLHHHTETAMLPEVRVLNRKHLRVFVDNNVIFWNSFHNAWVEALKSKKLGSHISS